MRKVIVGLVVVLIAGAGGYLGLDYWAQRAVAREVDAMLDGWRASIGSATHGPIAFDLWTRTVKITDVVVQPRSGQHPKIAVAQVAAFGVGLSGKADDVHLRGVEISEAVPGQPGAVVTYKAPSVTLRGFSSRPLAPRKVVSALDLTRLWLELASATTAASVEAPSLTMTMVPSAQAPAGVAGSRLPPGALEVTYRNLSIRDMREGRIAEARADGADLRAGLIGPASELEGGVGKIVILDTDVAPVLAVLDPGQPKGQAYQRVYRQVSVGPYWVRFADGTTVVIAKMVADDVGLRPDRLRLDDLQFLSDVMGAPGSVTMPGQLSMLMDKVAGFYEGVRLGRLQMQDVSVNASGGRVNLGGLHIVGLENGRIGELSLHGLNAVPTFGDPVGFTRVALKGFDIANLVRLVGTELAFPPGQPPGLDRLARMSNLLEGIELNGVTVREPRTGRNGRIDASVTSGPLIGALPGDVRASFKVAMPITAPAREPLINWLVVAGLNTLVAEADLGVRWNDAAETLAVEPATLKVDGVMAVSVKTSITKATRDLFSTDAIKAMQGALAVEIGSIEMTLSDLGMVDMLAAEAARARGQAPDAGRTLLMEQFALDAQRQTQLYPGAQSLYDAVGRFLQGKGETLTVQLTPRGRVRVLALIEALRLAAPENALLTAFTIEASSAK